ncbi:AfsR/SARP family transcriptional regulator [Amycolatopsis aidingensis]|uniref:AfsR/SARP family transcriptional regulator n=1 Tax=Amycolatopsis aidingensis TaxID=2842453 RepID=UPI001C0CBE65
MGSRTRERDVDARDTGAGESTEPAEVRIQLLGPVQLIADGRQVPVGGPGVRGLLALLALDANKVVTLDDIIDGLWGHEPPATARTIVHGNVSHLRRVLRSLHGEHPDPAGAAPVEIHTATPGYRLTIAPDRVDVHRARALLERAAVAPVERRAELLGEAFALWQGPVLGGVPASIAAPELEELRQAVHGARVDADLELGKHAELIAELAPLVRENPADERAVRQLMLALYRSGRRADALEVYRQASRQVGERLGIDLGPELRTLHDQLLKDELAEHTGWPRTRLALTQLPPAVPSLAGRAPELSWLNDLRVRAQQGARAIGVLTGAAGIGKSALAISWAHEAVDAFEDGVLFAALRGFDPHREPADPAEVLSHFLLGLGVPAAELPERLPERIALYRSLLAEKKVLVLLDDARTAEQVRPLLPPGARSLTLITSRSRLDGLAVSNAAKLYALDVLTAQDAVRLIEELAGPDPQGRHARLAELCGYLPLALRIAGARLAAAPEWTVTQLLEELASERTRLAALDLADADGGDTSVRAALDVSYRGLPAAAAAIFRALGALTSCSAGVGLAATACGVDPETARRGLRVLAAHHLLTETAPDVFTPHDLVRLYLRDLAAAELTGAERTAVLTRALHYYQASADRARRRLLRIVDPLEFTGLAGIAADPTGYDEALDWFVAEWPNLLAIIRQARSRGLHTEAWQLARVVHTYRVVRPLWDEWRLLVDLGLASAEDSGSLLGRCWMLISRCAVALIFGRAESSLADAEQALELAGELGDERLLISANIHLGCALTLCERYQEAISRLSAAIEDTERLGDLALGGQALNNCAEAEKRAGRYHEAIAHQLRSLEIDRKLGDDSYAVVSLNNLAEMQLAIGRPAESQRYAREAIAVTEARGLLLQEGVARLTLGRVLRTMGDFEGARAQFAASLELHERVSPHAADEVRAELEAVPPADS